MPSGVYINWYIFDFWLHRCAATGVPCHLESSSRIKKRLDGHAIPAGGPRPSVIANITLGKFQAADEILDNNLDSHFIVQVRRSHVFNLFHFRQLYCFLFMCIYKKNHQNPDKVQINHSAHAVMIHRRWVHMFSDFVAPVQGAAQHEENDHSLRLVWKSKSHENRCKKFTEKFTE